MSAFLHWRALLKGNAAYKHGAEVEVAIPDGFCRRFAIYAVRVVCTEAMPDGRLAPTYDVIYRVRDAEAAPDAHYRAGGRPPVIGEYTTIEAALAAIEPHRMAD